MSIEEAAEVILGGERHEKCPEGCDWGRIEVNKFDIPPEVEDVIYSLDFAKGVPAKRWVKCKRCNGSGEVTPQRYIDASAQLGLLVPQYPEPQSYTLTAWVHVKKP